MLTGEYSPSLFFTVPFYVTVVTLVIIYNLSQLYGHEPPFPHCWISGCAGHYPQFIFFRITTISGPVLIALGWLTNAFYLKTLCSENILKFKSFHLIVPVVLGMMGAMLLMGSTANIDTGESNGKWHQYCAGKFFIFTVIAQIYNTGVGLVLYERTKHMQYKMNKFVLYAKGAIFFMLVLQLLISARYGTGFGFLQQYGSDMDKILEWTLTVTVLAGFYAIGMDVKQFKFVYLKQ